MNQLQIPSDGFSLNPAVRNMPYMYYCGALSQMDTLRRANAYRPRWYVIPDDFNQPLTAYETLEYQIKVNSGSYLWGIRFIQFHPTTYALQEPTNIVLQITEACTGIPLFSEFVSPGELSQYTAAPVTAGIGMPSLLTQPRLFLEPGDVNVELCNLASTDQRCQLVLHFAEPCELVEE